MSKNDKSIFYLGGVFISFSVLYILISRLIPALMSVRDISASLVKDVLVNGVKECVVRAADNETTNFSDAQSFLLNFKRYKIQPLDRNSCYKAKAVPSTNWNPWFNNWNTWFEIDFNNETGEVSKTCGDSSKLGCEEGNTW